MSIRADRPPTAHLQRELRRVLGIQLLAACAPTLVIVAFNLSVHSTPEWPTVRMFQTLVFWLPMILVPPMFFVSNRWLVPVWPGVVIAFSTATGVFGLYRYAAGIIDVSPSGIGVDADFLFAELMLGSQVALGAVLACALLISERARGRGTTAARYLTVCLSVHGVIVFVSVLTYLFWYLGLSIWNFTLPMLAVATLIGTIIVLRQARHICLVRLNE